MTQWYAYYDKQTLELKSTSTVRPDSVPSTLTEVELAAKPDFSTQVWDKDTKQMVAKQPAIKPFALQDLFDRLTADDVSTILQALGIKADRAAELTADGVDA